MNFIEIVGLFVCFCGISSAFDLGKEYAKMKLLKDTVKQLENTSFGSVFKMILRYKLGREKVAPVDLKNPAYEDGKDGGESV